MILKKNSIFGNALDKERFEDMSQNEIRIRSNGKLEKKAEEEKSNWFKVSKDWRNKLKKKKAEIEGFKMEESCSALIPYNQENTLGKWNQPIS